MTSKLTITDERVISVIERLEHYACNLKWTNVRGAQDLLTAADGLRELQERRKAAMDSEPVAEITEDLGRLFVKIQYPTTLRAGTQLYRHAQPASVVPDAYVRDERGRMMLNGVCEPKIGFSAGWNACRATMLQAGTLTNEDTKQAWTGIPDIDNAINMLDRIDTLESCDDDRIEAVKTVLRRLAGNSPVIPDGLIAAVNRLLDSDGSRGCYSAIQCGDAHDEIERLLAAAPQDTPALNSVQSVVTVPGKWIPVSERMPDVGVKVLCFPVKDEPIHATFNGQLWLQDVSWSGSDDPIDNVIPVSVTHWMPLPAAPQEVK
ncbi:TPA: DUF551 domain-containing protein [Raoultella planticola]